MNHGWYLGLVLISSILTACGTKNSDQNGGTTKWSSFPVSIYASSSVTANSQSMSDFQDAMAFWEEKVGHKLFNFVGTWSGGAPYSGNPANPDVIAANILFFANPWPFAGNLAGQTVVRSNNSQITNSMVMINPGIGYCAGDCVGQNYLTSERKTFTHELGHFLGLLHAQDTTNIMYPSIQPGGSLASVSVDMNTLLSLTN